MSQLRKIRYRLFAWQRFPKLKPSTEPIDVVIPIIAKDLHILPLCLEGVRHQVPHPIRQIYIVAPAQQEIIQFCEERQLVFVDEMYVDHKMLFDKEQLEVLHHQLTREGLSWTDTILKIYDRQQPSAFSEFELYGNFVKDKVLRPWLQKRLSYKKLADYETLCRQWSRSRWSLTFPDYING